IYEQYDHQVMCNTVVVPGAADAAVLRIGDTGRGPVTSRAIAVSTDCNGRYVYLNPRRGAQIALAEACRNVSCTGAVPAGVTDCLNFGSPEKPEVYWTFVEAVTGLAQACRAFGVPVVSGNVSFYNESFGAPIYPTPTVGVVGILDDVTKHMTQDFKNPGDVIILIGETRDELGGSAWLKERAGLTAGEIPALDLALEAAVQAITRELIAQGLINSAHDVSEGGLAVALAESCLTGGLGARVAFDDGLAPAASLFSETQSRVLISTAPEHVDEVLDYLVAAELPFSVLGEVRPAADGIRILDAAELDFEDARAAWMDALPRLMGEMK
ncbi:MAG: AIR synthase related protein, partial [Actinomycetia bacterium]|nr:AIR synthase related protein [Actinomycetes bacterium]